MQRAENGWVYSPTDLVDLLDCGLRSKLSRAVADRLGWAPEPADGADELVVAHGQAHEDAVLQTFRETFGDGVVSIGQPSWTDAALRAAAEQTKAAMAAGAPVVYQGVFYDGEFYGRADFLVATDRDPFTGAHLPGIRPGGYEPYDTKLARHARPSAVLQLTAYAVALEQAGLPFPERMHLLLGDRSRVSLRVGDFVPLLEDVRSRLLTKLAAPARQPGQLWAEERPACATCRFAAHCADGREQARDLSLVAGIRADQRRKLTTGGVGTIDALATASDACRPANLSVRTFDALRAQARLQVAQDATRTPENPTGAISYEVVSPDPLALLPEPSAGDLYFDMEGDPYGLDNTGLEYLFGVITLDAATAGTTSRDAPSPQETFHAFWAHTRSQEKEAFEAFIDFAMARLDAHPDAHIYHYAPYEPSALKRLAAQHRTREDAVDDLLRRGALVDLYATVRKGLRVSQRSYSIKYLEPLYMPDHRTGEVVNAASSIVAYEEYLAHVEAGEDKRAEAALADISDYNEYDCVSTHRLYRWLLGVRDEAGIAAADLVDGVEEDTDKAEQRTAALAAQNAVADALTADLPAEAASWDDQAWARHLLAGAVGYYRREMNPVWWEFFRQAEAPLSDLESDPNSVVPVSVTAGEWVAPTGRARLARREIRLRTDTSSPHPFSAGDSVRLLYPATAARPARTSTATITSATAAEMTISEGCPPGDTWMSLPAAVLPGPPVNPAPKDAAVLTLAKHVALGLPRLPDNAALDLLRRRPPRLREDVALPEPDERDGDMVATVIAAVDQLENSYLAVQGPPGAGKTYLATQLIAHLLDRGAQVGVCSTSHKAIENVLKGVVRARPDLAVAKRPQGTPDPDAGWDQPKTTPALVGWRDNHPGGHLVGGTAWHFAHQDISADPLDVLIIDEAGQFALTDVLAVSAAARNLVLLGDPQQLPQVVAGTHPNGVDASALGHLLGEHEIVPASLGYFLEETRRMRPEVCAPVSALSYQGLLHSHPDTRARGIDGVRPGLSTLAVEHHGNTTASTEEAQSVVETVRALVGRQWNDGKQTRPLTQDDVLVVAPYNRQVRLLNALLGQADLDEVRVGTVDKFQGQEAGVVVVSMTASSAEDLPRGLDFLLSRNRLNVALSRAQVLAVLVCSPQLRQAPARTVSEMRLVSGLVGLTRGGDWDLLGGAGPDRLGEPISVGTNRG